MRRKLRSRKSPPQRRSGFRNIAPPMPNIRKGGSGWRRCARGAEQAYCGCRRRYLGKSNIRHRGGHERISFRRRTEKTHCHLRAVSNAPRPQSRNGLPNCGRGARPRLVSLADNSGRALTPPPDRGNFLLPRSAAGECQGKARPSRQGQTGHGAGWRAAARTFVDATSTLNHRNGTRASSLSSMALRAGLADLLTEEGFGGPIN